MNKEKIFTVKIEDIGVGERERKDFGEVDELAVSIQQFGMLHPITVRRGEEGKYILVAGERRLKAHLMLGIKEIQVKLKDDLNSLEAKEIEIEENVRRKDFSWQEELSAKKALMQIKENIYGKASKGHHFGFGLQEAADFLGQSVSSIGQDLQLADAMVKHPELAQSKNKSEAWKRFLRLKEGKVLEEIKRRASLVELDPINKIFILGDARKEMKLLEKESVDMVLVDFPYGKDIELKESSDGENRQVSPFQDGAFETLDLIDGLMRECFRVLKEDRTMLLFLDIIHVDKIKEIAGEIGFNVCPTPLVWSKTRGTGQPTNPTYYNPSYELLLHLQKGWRKMNKGNVPNVIQEDRVPAKNKVHPTQKPQRLLKRLISLHTLPGELVIDPCAGSGSTLFAALELERRAWGCEIMEDIHARGRFEIEKALERLKESPAEETDFSSREQLWRKITPGSDEWETWWEDHIDDRSDMTHYEWQLKKEKREKEAKDGKA